MLHIYNIVSMRYKKIYTRICIHKNIHSRSQCTMIKLVAVAVTGYNTIQQQHPHIYLYTAIRLSNSYGFYICTHVHINILINSNAIHSPSSSHIQTTALRWPTAYFILFLYLSIYIIFLHNIAISIHTLTRSSRIEFQWDFCVQIP